MTPVITFEQYLHKMGHTDSTVRSYIFSNKIFLADNPAPEDFTYKDVLNYLGEKGKVCTNTSTKLYILNGMKKYYDYLVEIGRRDDHPCKTFNFKSKHRREVIHQDLFSTQEMEMLLERENRYADLKLKNQALISLLIYQGASAGEIAKMKLQHVDFDKGLIFIKSSRKVAQRHVEIHPKQYRILDRYINECRPKLIRATTDILIVGKLGTPIKSDDVHYAVSTMKGLFPDRNLTPQTIRQSVIANWLNEKKIPLEQAQLMSGQKWISTTIKYRQNNLEEQRELMNKFFPI